MIAANTLKYYRNFDNLAINNFTNLNNERLLIVEIVKNWRSRGTRVPLGSH